MILQNVAVFSQRATWIRHKHTYLMFLLNLLSPSWFHPSAAAKLLQSCPTLCDPIDGSPPGSAVPGILQARTLEWVAISFSNAWKWKVKSEVAQSCPTVSDPMDCSLPGSSAHGIFQARVLEWDATAFSSHPSRLIQSTRLSSLRNTGGSQWLIYFTYGHESFHATLSVHLNLSSPLPPRFSNRKRIKFHVETGKYLLKFSYVKSASWRRWRWWWRWSRSRSWYPHKSRRRTQRNKTRDTQGPEARAIGPHSPHFRRWRHWVSSRKSWAVGMINTVGLGGRTIRGKGFTCLRKAPSSRAFLASGAKVYPY